MTDAWFFWSLVWLIPLALVLWLVFSWNGGRSSARWGREAASGDRYPGYPGLLGHRRPPGRGRGRGPRNYARSDARLEEEINDRLLVDEDIDASDMEVRVQDGVVTLLGQVESRSDKVLAETIADSVAGVRDVNNQLEISRSGLAARARPGPPEVDKGRA